MQKKEEIFDIVKAAHKGLDDQFGQDIIVLDIGEISVLSDYFIIATGSNPTQIQAMSDACEEACLKAGLALMASEGHGTGWLLLDFGPIIVHIFGKAERQFYNLERIWSDARTMQV